MEMPDGVLKYPYTWGDGDANSCIGEMNFSFRIGLNNTVQVGPGKYKLRHFIEGELGDWDSATQGRRKGVGRD